MLKKTSLLLVSGMLIFLAACGSDDQGVVSNQIVLPTDTLINLYCADEGIYPNTCILEDPDNPYRMVDVNEETKWHLNDSPQSPKARFYLWATALARTPTGENQYYVANALHELYTAGGSANAHQQAIRAYRAVLDNFYTAITYWEATWVDPVNPPLYAIPLKDLTGQRIYDPSADGLVSLFTNEWYALDALAQWGYTFDPTVGADSLSGTGTLQ